MAKIVANPALELAFVCDLLAPAAVQQSALIPDAAKRATLDDFESTNPQLVVEVAHPSVSKAHVRAPPQRTRC